MRIKLSIACSSAKKQGNPQYLFLKKDKDKEKKVKIRVFESFFRILTRKSLYAILRFQNHLPTQNINLALGGVDGCQNGVTGASAPACRQAGMFPLFLARRMSLVVRLHFLSFL